jgi:hypothetical protein
LVSVIHYAVKPDTMKVQPFFYRLKELNGYVTWLPGDEPELSKAQLNLAFYNGMPEKWRVRHAISGRSAHTTTRAELIHYFRLQEHKRMTMKKANAASARSTAQGNRAQRRGGQFREKPKVKPVGSSNGHKDGHAKHKKTGDKTSGTRICTNLTNKCPVHPGGNHTWGDCFQNVLNKDKKLPAKGSSKGKTASTHSAHEANLMDIDPPADNDAIDDIDLSGDECIVLDFNLDSVPEESKECDLDGKSNMFHFLTAAKAMIKAT